MRPLRFLALGFASVGAAATLSDGEMNTLLRTDAVSLAMKAQPMFLMGQMLRRQPCIPTFATNGSAQARPSKLCDWPDAACDCRAPNVPVGTPLPSFPVYFVYSQCSNSSVRVAYNLFYTKDGYTPENLFGHPLDWERVVVVWNRTRPDEWSPSRLFLSQHTGYQRIDWGRIKNTFATGDSARPRGGCDGVKNLDHPKVYIANAKHDMHQEKKTAFVDVLSQLTDNAFRSDDWWYFPQRGDYILADLSTSIGRLIASFDWHEADASPNKVAAKLCSA
ncbi:uncharacterized protein UV8b_01624 [Ustilaginoidea virens]|uniref:Uncharacterized protein n=1 Tax=Ustilaginoidea virens TaxID=1159556 RepID=A0A8E5HLC1_USTVR|nr:uncharacterized protein UV8b_01624 [Ustilaginoidea virens]QUC17383.1 hypothetical protein UV8b_01624 [Ustilaginoidea virens]